MNPNEQKAVGLKFPFHDPPKNSVYDTHAQSRYI